MPLTYAEILRQEYEANHCIFSAGFVFGDDTDSMYIRMEKDGVEPTILLFRPDEMAVIAWLATGVLWSAEMTKLVDGSPIDTK